ncbi:uncharacterized protein LOC130663422 [Microplitis mediator]|uniref:uncharacterized protein LOC130663422 n=1 Tax=Microplitis mediator TaxID=375433 RepID=UPI002556EE75|nr:uncharacterized protein LOC130663422 [Microplitis mediator]
MREKIFSSTSIWIILLSLYFCSCTCPIPGDSNVKNVDFNELVGEWFMVAGTPVREKVGKCLHFSVETNGTNSFSMNFSSNSPVNHQRVSWKVVGERRENETLATWQLNGSPNVLGPFHHKMLAMNNTHYCAMIVCTDNNYIRYRYRKAFGMIWSREKSLPSEELTLLKDEISQYINRHDIVDVDNSCPGISF